jgi:hypothetical protein
LVFCDFINGIAVREENGNWVLLQGDENALLQFLENKYGNIPPGQPEIFYDPKYALRLCLKEKRMRACVYIYSSMNMHEEAVALALQVYFLKHKFGTISQLGRILWVTDSVLPLFGKLPCR